ncbi:MAG: hypothetical protein KA004_19010 [Verrucomicrobiales bacterium]|nr:hypothetical protein [Verrucomicrobiales bacterium]
MSQARALFGEWNGRCQPPWNEREIAHKLASAERAPDDKTPGYLIWRQGGNIGQPRKQEEYSIAAVEREPGSDGRALEFDREALLRLQRPDLRVDWRYLAERSLVDPVGLPVEAFLDGLYEPGEKILAFTRFTSQGEFCYVPGQGWWRLGTKPAKKNEWMQEGKRPMGRSWREGVWFLAQPVTGGWRPEACRGERKWTRRSGVNVTAWRYMVVESDEKGIEPLWLNFLVQLPLPIVALYTSGGKSVHALLRVDAVNKRAWDQLRDVVRPFLTKCGADRRVFSAVRLTRLPGFLREGTADKVGNYVRYQSPREQRLLYFNPRNHEAGAGVQPICQQHRRTVLEPQLAE